MICARPEIVMASAQAPANCATFNIASEICFPRSAGNGAELEAALAECSFQGGSVQPVNFEAGRHFAACCGCSKLQCSQSISVFVLRTKQKLHQRAARVRRASLILGPFAQYNIDSQQKFYLGAHTTPSGPPVDPDCKLRRRLLLQRLLPAGKVRSDGRRHSKLYLAAC